MPNETWPSLHLITDFNRTSSPKTSLFNSQRRKYSRGVASTNSTPSRYDGFSLGRVAVAWRRTAGISPNPGGLVVLATKPIASSKSTKCSVPDQPEANSCQFRSGHFRIPSSRATTTVCWASSSCRWARACPIPSRLFSQRSRSRSMKAASESHDCSSLASVRAPSASLNCFFSHSRNYLIIPKSILWQGVSLREPLGRIAQSALSSLKPVKNNSTAAMQMQESATLNAGHQPPLAGEILS